MSTSLCARLVTMPLTLHSRSTKHIYLLSDSFSLSHPQASRTWRGATGPRLSASTQHAPKHGWRAATRSPLRTRRTRPWRPTAARGDSFPGPTSPHSRSAASAYARRRPLSLWFSSRTQRLSAPGTRSCSTSSASRSTGPASSPRPRGGSRRQWSCLRAALPHVGRRPSSAWATSTESSAASSKVGRFLSGRFSHVYS